MWISHTLNCRLLICNYEYIVQKMIRSLPWKILEKSNSPSVLSSCRFTGNCIGKICNLCVISIAVLIYIVLEVASLENKKKNYLFISLRRKKLTVFHEKRFSCILRKWKMYTFKMWLLMIKNTDLRLNYWFMDDYNFKIHNFAVIFDFIYSYVVYFRQKLCQWKRRSHCSGRLIHWNQIYALVLQIKLVF